VDEPGPHQIPHGMFVSILKLNRIRGHNQTWMVLKLSGSQKGCFERLGLLIVGDSGLDVDDSALIENLDMLHAGSPETSELTTS
jgi:hypothetical protein